MISKRYLLFVVTLTVWMILWLWASRELVSRESPISESTRALILFGIGSFFGTLTGSIVILGRRGRSTGK